MKLHYSSEELSLANARKLKATAAAVGAKLEQATYRSKDDISKISLFNTLPLLESPDGIIFSSNTIVRYLAATNKSELYGADNAFSKALIDQWLDFTTTEFQPAARAVLAHKKGMKIDMGKLMEQVNKFLAAVEKALSDKKFLVAESMSIADISLASSVSTVFETMFGEGQRNKYPKVLAWYLSIANAVPQVGPKELPKQAHETFKAGGKKDKKDDGKKKKEGKKQEKKKEEDDDDLFGDDDDTKPVAKPTPKVQPKKEKKKAVAKSIVVFDVKVYEQEEDLNKLFNKIKEIQMDGLVWNNEPKIVAVCFGMNKLQVGCVVEDEKVSLEDIYEKIEEWEEVQSVDTVSFQKL